MRCALPGVLMMAVFATDVVAQSPVCQAIRRGESAAQAARRLTGDGRNMYQAWFQIRNPSSRFVPKSQYNRIRAGWQACVIKPAIERASLNVHDAAASDVSAAANAPLPTGAPKLPAALVPTALATAEAAGGAGGGPQAVVFDVFRAIGSVDFAMAWLGVAMVAGWFGWRTLDDHLARRKTVSIVVRHFAHRFVDEFERPLVLYRGGERPVRSRLRCGARQGRFDIVLAPGEGRRYPNLSDHKKNVEYDVARVMRALGDDSFVNGAPYTQAGWVVVPFQFKDRPKRSGVS